MTCFLIGFVFRGKSGKVLVPGSFLQHPWYQFPRVPHGSGDWERKGDTWTSIGKEPGRVSTRRAWTSLSRPEMYLLDLRAERC